MAKGGQRSNRKTRIPEHQKTNTNAFLVKEAKTAKKVKGDLMLRLKLVLKLGLSPWLLFW